MQNFIELSIAVRESWVTLGTEKKLRRTQYSPSLPRGQWK